MKASNGTWKLKWTRSGMGTTGRITAHRASTQISTSEDGVVAVLGDPALGIGVGEGTELDQVALVWAERWSLVGGLCAPLPGA